MYIDPRDRLPLPPPDPPPPQTPKRGHAAILKVLVALGLIALLAPMGGSSVIQAIVVLTRALLTAGR